MRPISPVIKGYEKFEIRYGAGQEQYVPLPALNCDGGLVLSRWHLTLRERLRMLLHGDVYLYVMTCGEPIQPVLLTVRRPDCEVSGGEPDGEPVAKQCTRAPGHNGSCNGYPCATALRSDFEDFGGPLGFQTEKTH
jgi:hypothetical protein